VAWEERGGSGKRYLYRSVREGGRVRKEYLGSGWLAELAELQAEHERANERERVLLERRQVAAILEGEAAVTSLDRAVRVIVRAHLLAAGFRRHHRGEWRQRRASRSSTPRTATPAGATTGRKARR
jgi:hypothetical protein